MRSNGDKSNFLFTMEERFHFPFSRAVWHIVVAFACLAIAGGILYALYGIIPSTKEDVVKDAYPDATFAAEEDVRKCVNPVKMSEGTEVVTKTINSYELNFDTLKVALPPGKFQWVDREGSRYINWDTYEIVTTEPKKGLENKLRNALEGFSSSVPEQQAVVNNLAWVLLNQRVDYRENLLEVLMDWAVECKDSSMFDDWKRYVKVIKEKNNNPEWLLYRIARVRARNCIGGNTIVDEALKMTTLGDTVNKAELFDACVYGRDIFSDDSLWIASNAKFLSQKSLHKDVIKSLYCYYDITMKLNEERKEKIAKIEQEYLEKSVVAEGKYLIKKEKKSAARKMGFMVAIGASVVAAFFSLLLVLISMQRSLKTIELLLEKKEKATIEK